jgi:hypothetical protein
MRIRLFIFSLLFGALGCHVASIQSLSFVGDWSGKAPDGTTVKYSLHKDGSVVWFVDEANFKQASPSGMKAKYVIREKSPFWEIDIYDFVDGRFKGVTFLGILQPIDDRTFKMEGAPSIDGDRPKSFDEEAITFTKASA